MFWINRLFMNNIFVMFDYILYFINEYSAAIGIIITIIGAVCFYKKYDYTKKRDLEFYGNQEILKKRQEAYVELYKLLNVLQCKKYFSVKNKEIFNLFVRIRGEFLGEDIKNKKIKKNEIKRILDKTIVDSFMSYKFILDNNELKTINKKLNDIHINNSMFFSKNIFSKYVDFFDTIDIYCHCCSIFYHFLYEKKVNDNSCNQDFNEIKLFFICFFEKEIQNSLDNLKDSLMQELNSKEFLLCYNNINNEFFDFDRKFDKIFDLSIRNRYEDFFKEYIELKFEGKKLEKIKNKILEYDQKAIKPYDELVNFLIDYIEKDNPLKENDN